MIPLMHRVGFALQKGLARLSTAVRRERHSRQRPADVKSGYTHRTTVPGPSPLTVGYARDTLGYSPAIQNSENQPARVLGKAGTILRLQRNTSVIRVIYCRIFKALARLCNRQSACGPISSTSVHRFLVDGQSRQSFALKWRLWFLTPLEKCPFRLHPSAIGSILGKPA